MKNAGYTIEKIEITYQEFGYWYGIALAHNEKTNMWATWCTKQKQDKETEIDFFWGHYFDKERDARADYHGRLLQEYMN